MSKEETFVDVLRSWAARTPENTALTFLEDGEIPGGTLTYQSLDRRAREIGAGLRQIVEIGERVLLLHPPGLEFVTAFFGCQYAGVVPVPVYPPRNPRHFPRIEAILADADAHCVLTQTDFQERLAAWLDRRGGSLSIVCSDTLVAEPDQWEPAQDSTLDTLAFLQYTSGSTGDPKGVMVTHGNLMANQRMIQQVVGRSEGLVGVSWLPMYHDMGLIGNLMQPLFVGGHCVLMSPVAFLQQPRRWLAALSRFHAHGSAAPNFALRLCTKTIQGEQKAGLDLSALEVLLCGSEPINATDLEEFAEAFREIGFQRDALRPCYGMAEATLLATAGLPGTGPVLEDLEADGLAMNLATPLRGSAKRRRLVVGCGKPIEGQEVAIVDPQGEDQEDNAPGKFRALEEGRIGEIWLRGPNVARGYWRKPDLNRDMFEARLGGTRSGEDRPFLRTGDLGFLRDGELFVTGRIKDLIIIRGRNYYPHDIEFTVQHSHPAFRSDGSAAFSVEIEGEERLVVIQEINRHHDGEAEEAAARARASIVEDYELSPFAVVLVRQGGVLKTSSGKIQRSACAQAFLDGTLPVVHESRQAPVGAFAGAEAVGTIEARSREDIEDFLLQKLSSGLSISPDEIDIGQPFSSFGVDSVRAVALLNEVEAWTGRSLSPTLLWDYPTISDLAAYLAGGSVEVAARGEKLR